MSQKRPLNETYSEIAKHWHPDKNGTLSPKDISHGSHKTVWWKCHKCGFEWEQPVRNYVSRFSENGCRKCNPKSHHEIHYNHSLANTNPELLKEWDFKKNKSIRPSEITIGSNKKVWWKCLNNASHSYYESPHQKLSWKHPCPICNNRRLDVSNSLATVYPELAKQWHPSKNGDLFPHDIVAGSNKKVWWKCPKGVDHEWYVSPNSRITYNTGCPVCDGKIIVRSNSLGAKYPRLIKEWHASKNVNLTPYMVAPRSAKKVWWRCYKGSDHEYKMTIGAKTNGFGCPICSGQQVARSTSLGSRYPELAKEWHPDKNGTLTPFEVTPHIHKKVWWQCNKADDHVYKSSIANRTRGAGCPMCRGLIAVKSNCLSTTHPGIAELWHPSKNDSLTPGQVTIGSHKKVWWKCPNGTDHEWKSTPNSRARGEGCPICAGKLVVKSNCFATTHPKIAKELHPTKNGSINAFNIIAGSHKKVWWQCQKDAEHIWRTTPESRKNGTNCPFCVLTPQSRRELVIIFELKTIFDKINSSGKKVKIDDKLWAVDIFIPKLNLVIEYDGQYWHKGKRDLDKRKTKQLIEKGYNVIRVREKPLQRITERDIIIGARDEQKKTVDNIIQSIDREFKLNTTIKKKINLYLLMDDLQNEKALENYIDILLRRKSNKRKEDQTVF